MADNQETPDVSARDIAELLHRFDVTIAAHGKKIAAIERAVSYRADTQDEQLGNALSLLREIHATVREAAPLLQSRAAKALRAGGSVIDYLKAGRSGG